MTVGTQLVGRLLEIVGAGRWDDLPSVMNPDFEIVEAASLPWGGVYRGPEGYRELMTCTASRFTLGFAEVNMSDMGDRVALTAEATFHGVADRTEVTMSVVEIFRLRDGKLTRGDVFLRNTAALRATAN